MKAAAALLLLGALAAGPRAGAAQAQPDAATWAYELPHELMSPFCPGRALAECPSPDADKLRRWILDQSRAGATREEVEGQLYRTFGDRIRQAPRLEGLGVVAYAAPLVFLAAGGLLLFRFLRRSGGA